VTSGGDRRRYFLALIICPDSKVVPGVSESLILRAAGRVYLEYPYECDDLLNLREREELSGSSEEARWKREE